MKTFKIKDLMVTLEGVPRTPQTPNYPDILKCGILTTRCFFNNSVATCPLTSDWYSPITNCTGCTPIRSIYGGYISIDELEAMKLQIAEYEKALEATLRPETEDLDELESKLSAALHAVKEQKSKRGKS